MRFLFRSSWGESLGIARRVEAEGHDVLMCIFGEEAKSVGDGLIEKTDDFPAAVKWSEVIVYDGNNFKLPAEAELLRKTRPVVGSSEFGDKLEHNRPFAIDLVRKAGLRVPEYYKFSGRGAFDKARAFLDKQKDESGWVFKPNGDPEGIRTTVGKTRDELRRMLDYLEHRYEMAGESKIDFLLEERHEGLEVSTEAWFDGEGWSLPNGTLEKNRLMNDNLGEMTGCSGNVVWLYESMSDPLPEMLLLPLTDSLKGKYKGPVDINAIIDEDGPIFLEFSPRFGYSAIFALAGLIPDDMARLLAAMASGQRFGGGDLDGFACGVRMSIPPYPINVSEGEVAVDFPVLGWSPTSEDYNVNPCEIRLDEMGEVETSGPDGIIFEIVGVGESIRDATEDAYAKAEKISIGGGGHRYRTDIGPEAERDFDKLSRMGYVRRRDVFRRRR